jgi:tRNA pseudouridine38-40 synthase
MVRRMVGVLVAAGLSALDEQDVLALLREPSRLPADLTAPPSGLFLERVSYVRGETVPDAPPFLTIR